MRARGADPAQGATDPACDALSALVETLDHTYQAAWAIALTIPSSSIQHRTGLIGSDIVRLRAGILEYRIREANRHRRREENAHDRRRRMWEPHQIRAAEKMGFEDPADWRQYIDEREASSDPSSFPTPEEWRAR